VDLLPRRQEPFLRVGRLSDVKNLFRVRHLLPGLSSEVGRNSPGRECAPWEVPNEVSLGKILAMIFGVALFFIAAYALTGSDNTQPANLRTHPFSLSVEPRDILVLGQDGTKRHEFTVRLTEPGAPLPYFDRSMGPLDVEFLDLPAGMSSRPVHLAAGTTEARIAIDVKGFKLPKGKRSVHLRVSDSKHPDRPPQVFKGPDLWIFPDRANVNPSLRP
jgi:hypothetical protein